MSTADLTRTWCEIEVLIDSVAPFLQEVVTGNGSNYGQFSAEIRNRLQKVVLLSRRARQISSDVQRITTSKSQRVVQQQHHQHQHQLQLQNQQQQQQHQQEHQQPPQMVPPSAAASPPTHPFQLNSVSVPTQPVVQPNLQYRLVDGKVQAVVGQESGPPVQQGGNWQQRGVVVDNFGQNVGLRAVPVGAPTIGPPTKKQAVVYDLTETTPNSSAPPPGAAIVTSGQQQQDLPHGKSLEFSPQ
ncbi:hypothetical protein BSKO_09027 [Bryopsis sp. KO-2023]|nr:hypothetical protein BSKO_09027 [Bryopsis sp. KO-2023]